ncbi:MAG: radical SAM protein [Spirochaetes bacterium]|nr:radical SAM protein [Spirochaetota bacterium]
MKRRTFTVLLGLLLGGTVLGANDLVSAEYDVVVRPDGKAAVYESLDWTSPGGMHGFYFEGVAGTPVFNDDQCYADLGGNQRVGLSISKTDSDTWDIVLAGGRAFSGSAMYFLNYGVDLASDGSIGSTTSDQYGSLFYFDWAPEQWDEPLEHRTVRVVLPVTVSSETVGQDVLTQVDFRTEQYVNEENATIDWFGTKGDDGKYYLTARFHQTNVATMQTQRLQFYLKLDTVGMQAGVLTENSDSGPSTDSGVSPIGSTDTYGDSGTGYQTTARTQGSPVVAGIVFAAVIALVALLYWRKSAGFAKTVESVEKIKWAGDNWIPPKLVVGTYQVKGKVPKDLHPVEAALLLEMPLNRVVALMLEGLKRQNIIEVVQEDPLQIKVLTASKAEHEYEELFLQAFDTEGKVLSGLLSDFFEKVLQKLQEKVWDCDLEATKAYYQAKLESLPLGLPLRVRVGEVALTGTGPRFTVHDLAWIDGFFREVRGHVFVRSEDGVLILPPNQVFRLNEGGLRIVGHLLSGRPIARLPGIADGDRAREVHEFCSDLRDFYQGDSSGLDARASVERVPYTFDFTRLPILGEIAVTYACNNACRFCYAGCGAKGRGCGPSAGPTHTAPRGGGGRGSEGAPAPDMTLAEAKRVIDVFKREAQIPFFSFTGGEPLLRRDLEAMIRHARRLGLEVNLVTNGTLADPARARSLARAGLRTAQVSVEAPDAETHDDLTTSPGSFDLTLAGIRSLQAAGISVQTNTTVTAMNAGVAHRMPGFLKSLGIARFAMNLYIPAAGGVAGASPADPLFFPYSRIGHVIDAVRAAARAAGLTFYWYSPTPHCLYNPIARGLGNKSCAAMDGLLSVSPSGDVLPCSSYPQPMGSLLREGFRAIWFSAGARHFKQKEYAPAECAGCESFRACQSACPLYWSRAGTAEIRNPSTAAAATAEAAAAGR